ncbi:MAG TPA: NAD(P)/FAD-dependent oxidoreductase [Nitrospiria bacterium]|nr:NAD(P)/FAD-dependent oxidoreductase [Nitrospiria bacterium]
MHAGTDETIAPAVTRRAVDRFHTLDRETFDVIVVGAGTGGLTVAALLARTGRSVLVLDQHSVAGGNATVFTRPGYAFDVGLHYLGDCGPDGGVPRILRAAGVEDVAFREMDPDGFDTLMFPDFTFRVPKGLDAYRARLVERFPLDVKGIDRYLDVLQAIWSFQGLGGGFAASVTTLWRARRAVPYLNATLQTLLDRCTRNTRLRAVLAGQSGDYAEPPSRVSLVVHAMVVMGYLRGAYYPAGGGQVISDRLAGAIERHGGKILLSAPVTRIVIENGRAAGVEFESRHLGHRAVRAPVVISDADVKETMLELVGAQHLKARTVARLYRYEMAPALGVAYLGVKRNLHAAGVPNTNFWIHPSYDQEPVYADARAGRFHPEPFCYVSIATLKDPDNRRSAPPGVANIELATVVPSQPEAWGTTPEEIVKGTYHDNPAYRRAKDAFAARLIATADRVFPGLAKDVVFQDVSSPMTHTRYTRSTGGTAYGIALIPSQSLFRRVGHVTDVPGLYLCGASTYTGHGITGVMWSGVLAASRIAGGKVLKEVMR